MRNWTNWILVIGGVVCVIAELLMGAVTGFDLALIGGSMIAGGAIGLAFGSTQVGLLATSVFGLIYFAFFRRWLKHKLHANEQPSNVDAIVGRSGVVTVRVGPHEAGHVKVGDEMWRAELANPSEAAREPGTTVTVTAVEGVTLKVN